MTVFLYVALSIAKWIALYAAWNWALVRYAGFREISMAESAAIYALYMAVTMPGTRSEHEPEKQLAIATFGVMALIVAAGLLLGVEL